MEWKTLATYVSKPSVLVPGVGALSLAGGALGGYLLAKRRLETKYEQFAEQEIAEAKKYFSALYKTDQYSTPEAAAEALRLYKGEGLPTGSPIFDEINEEAYNRVLTLQQQQLVDAIKNGEVYISPNAMGGPAEEIGSDEDTDDLTEAAVNIFNGNVTDDVDPEYEQILAGMEQGYPYCISQEEHFENSLNYEQVTLTYYEGDDVLADEADKVVPDVERIVGLINLRFGYRSSDANIVYVRNDKLGLSLEIIRSFGKYSVEVAGFDDPDLQKANGRRPRRSDDG